MKKENGGILDGDFVSLRGSVVEGRSLATDDQCRVGGYKAGVWERKTDESEREQFKREVGKAEKEMYADVRNDGDDFEREDILDGGGLKAKSGAKVFVCNDKIGKDVKSAITDETRLMGREKK